MAIWQNSFRSRRARATQRALALAVACGSWAFLTLPSSAVVVDWSGTAGTTDWATGTNWGGTAPTNDLTTDIARFNQTSYTNQPTITGNVSIAGLAIGNGTTATADLTLSGGNLSLGSSGITMYANAGNATISANLTLGASQTWTNNSTNALAINGSLSRSSGITLNFAGSGNFTTTSLANTNGILGPWATYNGNDYATNNGSSKIVALTYGGDTEQSGWTSSTSNYRSTTANNTLTASRSANTIKFAGGSAQTVDLGSSGANTLTLNGMLSTGAGVTIQRTGGTGSVVIGSTNELVIGGSANTTISVPITGTGSITKAGTGTVKITDANNNVPANQTFNLSGGTLALKSEGNLGSGGNITVSGGYVYHTFLSSGTLNVPATTASILVVGGGGGGGNRVGGGGGAGGLVYNAAYSITTGDKTITIGAGGAGSGTNGVAGTNGNNSVFDASGANIIALGGGGGASYSGGTARTGGGSGGGAAFEAATPGAANQGSFSGGWTGYGNAGGTGSCWWRRRCGRCRQQ